MTAIISFSEETSREIAALAEAEGANVDQWLNRYVIDIHRYHRNYIYCIHPQGAPP